VRQDNPFDAVLIIAFGGPNGPGEVRPFLENMTRSRRVSADRLDEIERRYVLFGGVSPLTAITRRQADKLRRRLREAGIDLPVYIGMRNWHPFLTETLTEMARAGVRRAIGFIAAPHQSEPSCGRYKQNLRDARTELAKQSLPDIEVTYIDSWYDHDGFITANANQIRKALEQLEPSRRDRARIVFTAHSIPESVAKACRYVDQIVTTAKLVAAKLS